MIPNGANLQKLNKPILSDVLAAIGRWQASPTMANWQLKMAVLKQYIADAERWELQYRAALEAEAKRRVLAEHWTKAAS